MNRTSIRTKQNTLKRFNEDKKKFNPDKEYKADDFLNDLLSCFEERYIKGKV